MFKEGQENFEVNLEDEKVINEKQKLADFILEISSNNLKEPEVVYAGDGKLSRRDVLKMTAAAGLAAVFGMRESKAGAAEQKELKEKMTEKQKLQNNLRKFFNDSMRVEDIDAGKEGLIVSFGNLGNVLLPEKKFIKCNDRIESSAEKVDDIEDTMRFIIAKNSREITKKEADTIGKDGHIMQYREKFYKIDDAALVKNEQVVKVLEGGKKKIEEIETGAIESISDMGDNLTSRELENVEYISDNFKEKINGSLVKLKNGGFGYKKTSKDGSVKYIEFTPKE